MVHGGTLGWIDQDFAIADNQVVADDDTDITGFQTLAGVDAANLVNGFRVDDPGRSVFRQVPFHAEVVLGYDNVHCCRIFPAVPVPTITGHQTRFVVDLVLFLNAGKELVGRIDVNMDPVVLY